MQVEHMVWFKWNDDVTEARIEELMNGLRALPGKVPGIVALKAGKNFTDRSQGYTHGLSVTLENKAALPIYADHPEHMAVAKQIRACAQVMAMDFEF